MTTSDQRDNVVEDAPSFYVGEHVQLKGCAMQVEAIGVSSLVLRFAPNQKITERDIAGFGSASEGSAENLKGLQEAAQHHFHDTQKHTMFVGGPKNG